MKNRMREICTSGSVGGEGGNVLAYPAIGRATPPNFFGKRKLQWTMHSKSTMLKSNAGFASQSLLHSIVS
jgi:hypothetical protein